MSAFCGEVDFARPGDARWIAGDARLDEREALLAQLGADGACSDLELVLLAYERWGHDAPSHLVGDFAFAIWDPSKRELFCARDPFGVKPFYSTRDGSRLAFASGIAALRRDATDALNDRAIADFLLFSIALDRDATSFRDIHALPAAHVMIASADGIRVRRYWDLPIEEPLHFRDPAEYVDGFRNVLRRAVADRITSDRIAVSMSGGLDSSSIAALAAARARVTAFTNVFEPLVPDEERRFALLAASYLGIDIEITEGAGVPLFDKWERPEYQKEEPCNDPLSSITTDALRRAAERAPVMLSGQGGDAVLYASHSYFFNLLRGGRWIRFAAEVAGHLAAKRRLPPLCLRSSLRRALGRRAPSPEYPNWIAPELERRLALRERWDAYWADEPEIHPTRPQAFNLLRGVGWQRLHEYVDAEAMGARIEYRNPLLDVRVVRYLLRVPPMPWFAEKEILRAAMKGALPEDVRLRRKTAIAIDPTHIWLDRQADALCRAVAAMESLEPWVNRERVMATIKNERRSNYDSFLLVLPVSLGLWIAAKMRESGTSSIICMELSE